MAISRLHGGSLEAYLKAKLEQEVRESEPVPFRGSITVSRESGCRAVSVCELLAGYLSGDGDAGEGGWMVHDKEIVEHIIEENHLPEYLAPHLEEVKPDVVEEHLAAMLNTRPSDRSLFQKTVEAIRKLARIGDAIIVGRGGNFITADMKNCFRVRLIGSERERLEVISETRGVDDTGAAAYMRRTDRDRLGYVRSNLHKDSADPLGYHVVFNTDGTGEETTARMIGDMYLAWKEEHAGVSVPTKAAV